MTIDLTPTTEPVEDDDPNGMGGSWEWEPGDLDGK